MRSFGKPRQTGGLPYIFKGDFSDARKILSELGLVLGCRGTELVKINLLVEVEVDIRALALRWIACVEDAGAIRVPRRTAAAGWVLGKPRSSRPPPTCGIDSAMCDGRS